MSIFGHGILLQASINDSYQCKFLKVANHLYALIQMSAVLLGYWGQFEEETFHCLKQFLINAPIYGLFSSVYFQKCIFSGLAQVLLQSKKSKSVYCLWYVAEHYNIRRKIELLSWRCMGGETISLQTSLSRLIMNFLKSEKLAP